MDNRELEIKYEDVLHDLEGAIIAVDKANLDLTDLEVMDALDNLMRAYTAEANGRSAPFMRLSPLKRQVYDAVKTIAEWRMGRECEPPSSVELVKSNLEALRAKKETSTLTLDEMQECLKRIRLSVKRWNGSNGRRGYLEFIHNFFL